MIKKYSRTGLFLALSAIGCASYASPSSDSPYYTDVQAQYPQDKAQDTFQSASFISCFITAMAPQVNVGVGQYLAYVDENKCEDSGASANTSTSSGATSVAPSNYSKALVTVSEAGRGELAFDVVFSTSDEENNVKVPKNIQVKGKIRSGPAITPPYGDWEVHYCSSSAGNAGACDDGRGYAIVNGSGISVYDKSGAGYRSGKSVYSSTSGNAGYGIASVNEPQWNNYADVVFGFAPGLYSLKDRRSGSDACFNPSTRSSGAKFSTWETFLYDKTTGQKVQYDNGGFRLKSNLTGYTVGEVNYWGVSFWNEANATDQLEGAVLLNADDGSRRYTLKKAPGRLQKTTTKISTGLADLDGVPLNFGVWGWLNNQNQNIGNKELLNSVGVSTTSNNLSLIGSWSAATGAFVITGYQDCSNGCRTYPVANQTQSFSQLRALGVENVNAWVNGVNANYNFVLKKWNSSTNQYDQFTPDTVRLIKQSSEVVSPGDSTVPSTLVCVGGSCPSVSNGQLVDVRPQSWPATSSDVVTLNWNPQIGAPTVTAGGVTLPVDWRVSGNDNNGHYYQLYANTNGMTCGSGNNPTGGLCPDQVRDQESSVYYTWQSGNKWDAYNYLVDAGGQPVQARKPMALRYNVASAQGTSPGFVGKTITVESPRPGNLWLPGHCVDPTTQADMTCSNDSRWVNDVVIPFAADQTGTLTLLNEMGQPTSTEYYAKWLRRGVFFEALSASSCSGVSADVTKAAQIELPGISSWDAAVKSVGLPWPTAAFEGKPRVIDGVLQ